MLRLLLDEHISPQVAKGLRRSSRGTAVYSLSEWEAGNYLGRDDEAGLREAAIQKLTLVTYDRRTIPPLLKNWAEAGLQHGGVIFIDEKTIPPADIGGLVRALRELLRETRTWNWTNRVSFLRR
jgi:hypothetical protein